MEETRIWGSDKALSVFCMHSSVLNPEKKASKHQPCKIRCDEKEFVMTALPLLYAACNPCQPHNEQRHVLERRWKEERSRCHRLIHNVRRLLLLAAQMWDDDLDMRLASSSRPQPDLKDDNTFAVTHPLAAICLEQHLHKLQRRAGRCQENEDEGKSSLIYEVVHYFGSTK